MVEWKNEEIAFLIENVKKVKNLGKSMQTAFDLHAKKYSRSAGSVKNFYYKILDELKNNEEKCKEIGVDLKELTKSHFVGFDKNSEGCLVEQIDSLIESGYSVRGACEKISCGNVTLMTRLQNKYQNLKKKQNIVVFKKPKILTNEDINSLLQGLVKLIKKNAIEEYSSNEQSSGTTFLLRRAFVDLNKKDKQILELKAEFELLKKENENLKRQLQNISKANDLKNFFNKKDLQKLNEN